MKHIKIGKGRNRLLLGYKKDGGAESNVGGWFFEWKRFFTVALLKFDPGTREAYHSHAFDCASVVLGPGYLVEYMHAYSEQNVYSRGSFVKTFRDTVHKVRSVGTTWVLTARGPWTDHWVDIDSKGVKTLTHGREAT